MSPMMQPGIWPSLANSVASPQATQGNSIAVEGISLVEAVSMASARLGFSNDDFGGIFGISKHEVTKCFGPNYPTRNALMKHPLPLVFARQVALAMCEQTGLAVAGPDAERHALADVLRSCADYVRVMGR